ncbi:Frataxin [Spironucleus salmonicida]|uniref:Frataxin n=1 Tax=Spironucleus salmonicida TaxID=348837 RepID=K7R5E3_9EUKA|nr:frataxin [Spironucleus salmonicida]KAH0569833.1 Frataxin [Spironucleus salmonicida]|eukprot:EST48875.1 Frataxin [Spironucleus salmonicida]
MTYSLQVTSVLNNIQSLVEKALNVDTQLSYGVLQFPANNGQYVLNKQNPTQQLWLSSPVSGPSHFDLVDGKFKRNGVEISDLLKRELGIE